MSERTGLSYPHAIGEQSAGGDWMTPQEVADYLRVSRRMVAKLDIPRAYVGRLPRYARAEVNDWMAARVRALQQKRRRAPQGIFRVPPRSTVALEDDLQALKLRLRRNAIKQGD